MTSLLNPTEAEAAELEAVRAVDNDTELYAKIVLARTLKDQRDAAIAAYDAVKEDLGKSLHDAGLQGYTLGGKVAVRRSIVHTNKFDGKSFKEKHPKIWAAFVEITESVRVTVG